MLNKETHIKEEPLHANIGEHVGYEVGAKMIKDYFDKYKEGGSQFIGRNILEQILAQPDCIGIKVFKALNEAGEKTYVIVGVDGEGKEMLSFTVVNPLGEMNKQEGIVADRNKGVEGWIGLIGL